VVSLPAWIWSIPEYFNIGVACTDTRAATHPEHPAVIIDDDTRGVQQLTFAQLAAQTGRFGEVLRALGVTPGDRVLIRLPNCIEYPVAFLGAMKCGAIPVPTSILLTTEEVRYVAHDCGARVLVTDPSSREALKDAGPDQLTHVLLTAPPRDARNGQRVAQVDLAAALTAASGRNIAHPTRAEDPAYLVYTSGTTGYPKGVLHAHRALLGRQPSSTYWFDFLPDGDRVLHSGKFNWTYVLGTGLMDPLFRGHTAILHEGSSDANHWIPLIAKHRATTFIGVPTLYRHIIQRTTFARADVPTLRHCMSAGEQLSAELLEQWRARFGLDIYEGLGMTECSYYLCETTSRPIRPGSAGFAQPGHDVKLLDPGTLAEVAQGEEGMLCIPRADPALLLRYWNQPEETARCCRGEWFLTGDYARQDADGYLWFLGRKDDLIKSFGYRVSPHEIERVLKEHADIADAAAIGESLTPEKVLVVAYVVPRAGSGLVPDNILAYARQHLASYKVPKIIYFVDDLPRTRNGKLQRRALSPANARERST